MDRALVLAPFSAEHLERLRQTVDTSYESWMETRSLYDPEGLADRINRDLVTILVVEADFVFEEVFAQAAGLRFVGVCRNSTRQVDTDAATEHGVVVVNTPFRNAEAVAEHVLGLMLSLARRLPAAHRYVADGRWDSPVEPYISMRGIELAGRTVGVLGLGAIGRRVAALTSGIGMRVLAFDPYVAEFPEGVGRADLPDLMRSADFVAVTLPATASTRGVLGSDLLALMKPTSYLVSTSDASVLDQAAAVAALREGRIAGAAFDVFETHPISPDSPLLGLDDVVLTPHLGGATQETIGRHSRMMTDDVLRFLAGERPIHLINTAVWERRGS